MLTATKSGTYRCTLSIEPNWSWGIIFVGEGSPELELITSKHYLIETPNSTASTTSSMATSSSSNENTSTQDVGDMIYNRVSNKIADLVDREFDKVLNPDASTDDKYILKARNSCCV
mgnify:CR=1 FL=1